MGVSGKAVPVACLIVARQLGDATISSGFLRQLTARGFAQQYLVWTRPHFAFLFEDFPDCQTICSQFPVGTTKHFGLRAAVGLARAARAVRRYAPNITIDLIGDFRERLFARMAGSRRHLHIGWSRDHAFARIIRNPFGAGSPHIQIPAQVGNVYAAYERLLDSLAPPSPVPGLVSWPLSPSRKSSLRPRVGLHPFASQKCRMWPDTSWRHLIKALLERNVEVVMFAAPSERVALTSLAGEHASRVTLVTESLGVFAAQLRELDVLVGLDSFSVHMAQLQGIRSLALYAGSPPALWAPPGCTTLSSSGGCQHYPCFNKPKCEGEPGEHACIRSISPEQVLQAVNQLV